MNLNTKSPRLEKILEKEVSDISKDDVKTTRRENNNTKKDKLGPWKEFD